MLFRVKFTLRDVTRQVFVTKFPIRDLGRRLPSQRGICHDQEVVSRLGGLPKPVTITAAEPRLDVRACDPIPVGTTEESSWLSAVPSTWKGDARS
jgi:hypothetical protein